MFCMVIALGLSRWPQNILPQCLRVFCRVSVGWSDDFSAHEKQHKFYEHESSHQQHDFPRHGHDFSKQHEQTHVEQIQLPHVGGDTLEGSAVGSRLAIALECSW